MERELATTSQEFEFRPQSSCGSPLSELSDFGQSAQTKNVANMLNTRKKVRFHALCKFDAVLNCKKLRTVFAISHKFFYGGH